LLVPPIKAFLNKETVMKKKLLLGLSFVIFTGTFALRGQVPVITITNLDTLAIQGMPAQPVLKMNINAGSANYLSLQNLVIKSLCQDSTDIDSVAVYYTGKNNRFSFADYSSDIVSLLTKRQKFHKDSVTFASLTFNLDTGTNYFWVVLDLSKTSKAAHYLNATIRAGGITISGSFYPVTAPPLPTQQINIWQKYFTENFEKANTDGTPYGWISKYYDSDKINWTLHQGGFGTNDNIPGTGNPSNAKSGKTNARFAVGYTMWRSSMLNHIKPIDLTLAVKPLMVFYHAQMYDAILSKQDSMSVYYQLLPDTTWRYMKGYQLATPNDGSWVKRQIVLPDAMSGKNVNIGFRGYANYGWGVCIDSIVVYETQVSTRIINSINVTQPNTSFVPQSSTDNPILRVDLRIKGNTSSITLNSFAVTSGNTSDGDVTAVKLYYTNDSVFMSPVLVGTGSFSSGKATFSGLNRALETGENYYWITYDVASNANPGNILDAYINTNDIVTTSGNYPSTNQSPVGNRIVKQTIFWDGFETDKGWGLRGDFQRAAPQGKGVTWGYPDPTKAYSGSMELGENLTSTGLYENNLTYATADTATSPLIQAKYFKNVQFSYARWLNVEGQDSASIDIKYAGDTNWKTIWNNNRNTIVESSWSIDTLVNSKLLFDRKNFRIRYRLGPTDPTNQYSGWNVDNVFFTGDSVKWDAAVTKYLAPISACGLTSSEHFKVRVKNTGPKILTNIPIKLSIDGGNTWTTETISGPIAIDDSLDYTFTTATDVSKAKLYNVIVKTAYPGDNYPDNDSIAYTLTSVPTYTLPYKNGFEQDTTFWSPSGLNSSWYHGVPGGDYINTAAEGTKCWKTDWSGYFILDENSYVESPCYDFSNDSIPIINFKSSYVTSPKVDGTKIEYSLDGGASWTYLPVGTYPYSWSWYNDTIHAFHALKGWTGRSQDMGAQIWEQDRRIVREVANKTNVKFRFNFKADSSTTIRADGFAFDDFNLLNAPFDIGVDSILNLQNNARYCQYEKNGIVQVRVRNYGIRNMHANDTIIIGVKVDSKATVVDTFKLTSALNSSATQLFTMKRPVNIVDTGTHKIMAFTMIEKDPYFYSATSNDSDFVTISVKPNPVTNLPDTVYSALPDTLQIKAKQVASYQYSWEYGGSVVSTTDSVAAKDGLGVVRVGDFYLTVTDNAPGNGCVTHDSVYFKLLKSDIGVSKILEPVTNCGYGASFRPVVRLKNFGTDTIKRNKVLPLKTRLTIGGVVGSLVDDSYTLTNKFAPGDSIDVTLGNIVDLSAPGNYSFMVKTVLSNDIDYTNDSSVNAFQIYGYPSINLGPNVYQKALSYTILAPTGYASYLWNDGTSKDSLVVTSSGKYKVTVTNTNNCQTSDSVNVMLSIHDLAIKRVISPLSFCTKPGLSSISVKLMNNGSDTIPTTEHPVMSYSLNGATPVTQNLTLSSNLLPGDSVTFTFTNAEDIHLPSTYNFLIKATASNDLRRANDSILNVVKVFSNPVIDLGNDNIVHALEYKLTPGSNYSAYKWQDNSSDSTYTITQTHKSSDNTYDVTVTDGNGCTDRDTVHIYFYVDDLSLDSIEIPNQVCSQPFPVKIKVSNTGSETYVKKDVVIRYTVNSDPEVMEAVTFSGNPNDSVYFTFNTQVTPNALGTNKIKASIEMIGDLRRDNDTLSRTFSVLNGVNIDFGALNDTLNVDLPHTLDAGSGTNYSYIWSTSATTQTISATTDGKYAVTVTDGSCTASKSVTVVGNIYDLGISGFTVGGSNLPLTICKLSTTQAVGFEVQNMGNVSLNNQSITITYQINKGSLVSKTVSFTGGKLAKNSYLFDNLLDMSQAVIDTFNLSLTYAQDEVSTNNIKTYLMNVLDKPVIHFTGAVNDTVKAYSLPITLNPGSGTGYTYAWYDGSTTPTISTSDIRWHSVTISNGYCAATDSVWVTDATPVLQLSGSSNSAMIVYPNPVSDNLNVELSIAEGDDVTFEIYSGTGAIVKSGKLSSRTQSAQTINMADLPKGVYYLRAYRKNWAAVEKIIVR
jgi:hypothetical protein